MNPVLAVILISIVSIAVTGSLIINIKNLKWRADVQTYEGRAKLVKIGYERLELVRMRPVTYHRGYHADSDYVTVPLDEPMKAPRGTAGGTWKSVTGVTAFDSPLGFQTEDVFDELRVYGWKEGRKAPRMDLRVLS